MKMNPGSTVFILFSLTLLTLRCSDSVSKTITVRPQEGSRYGVDAQRCTGCGSCYELCPEQAVIETMVNGHWVYIIDPDHCVGCGKCINACTYGAITRLTRRQ